MTNDLFVDPGGNRVEWADLLGKLLLIWSLKEEHDIDTKDYGKKDAIRADIVVLDEQGQAEDIPDVLVFPLVLQGQLRRAIGKPYPVIGRLTKDADETDSKGRVTRQGPWRLADATEAEKRIGAAYLEANQPAPTTTDTKFGDVPF